MNGISSKTGTKRRLSGSTALSRLSGLAMLTFGTSLLHIVPAQAQQLPTGGSVTVGNANITTGGNGLTVNQTSQNVAINWNTFNIGSGNAVTFVQPNSNSIALNRVVGADPSVILGNLSANGQVFLINPNGVLFGQGAQVNVGGLVASTLDMSDADLVAGRRHFAGSSGAAVLNQGSITASSGGYVALLGANVSNTGVISARLGTVALAAGQAVTLDVAGDGLLNVTVDTGAVNALVSNGGMIRADGGQVMLTAQAAGQLLRTVVNNTGVIEARTLQHREGKILLLGDMASGTVQAGGVLDASAPAGGHGGFVETSAATVKVADDVHVTTAAPFGATGTWLIDPQDFIIAPLGGNISGATLSAQLVTNSVVISTIPAAGDTSNGNGDIFVNDAVAWTASGTPTTLTLNAFRDAIINAPITATNGNIVACCGRDVIVNAPLTTTNGSILLNAGRDVRVFHAITTTDGNVALCAGHDVHIAAAIVVTRGSTIPAQSLGLPVGLTLIAGADGSGPGAAAGTLIFAPLTPPVTVTATPVTINYNPVSYSAPTDFGIFFTLTEGAALTQRMLLFPQSSKVADGTTSTVLSGFRTTAESGSPDGVTLVAGPDAVAIFDSAGVGSNVGITFSGYSLGGPNANRYALAGSCCVSTFRTRGTISAASAPPPTPAPTPAPAPSPTPPPPAPTPTPPPPPPPPPPLPPPPPPPPPPTPTPPPVVVVPPVVTPPVIPPVVELPSGPILVGTLPAYLVPAALQVVNLAVIDRGVRMPAAELQKTQPAPVAPEVVERPAPPVAPAPRPRPVYAPKQDRN